MNFKDYTENVKRTVAPLEGEFINQLHMSIGIATEAGELLDAYKKTLAYNKKLDVVNVGEEIGDLMWYIANLTDMLGLNMDDILSVNVKKLQARYPDKFDTAKAEMRDLDAERAILERLGYDTKNE